MCVFTVVLDKWKYISWPNVTRLFCLLKKKKSSARCYKTHCLLETEHLIANTIPPSVTTVVINHGMQFETRQKFFLITVGVEASDKFYGSHKVRFNDTKEK